MLRSEFILANIVTGIIWVIVVSLAAMIPIEAIRSSIIIISALIVFWLTIVFTVRRLHDLNLTGALWFVFFFWHIYTTAFQEKAISYPIMIGFIFLMPALILLFTPGTRGLNSYGEDPKAYM
jgi:uncharacterized membrane protein YhaH (DUF805 family)